MRGGVRRDREEANEREGDDCSEGENRGTEEPPLLAEMSLTDWVTHHHLNASLSAGTPCCPSTSPSCHCPENPGRDDYRCDKEIRITLLKAERNNGKRQCAVRGGGMAEAARLT